MIISIAQNYKKGYVRLNKAIVLIVLLFSISGGYAHEDNLIGPDDLSVQQNYDVMALPPPGDGGGSTNFDAFTSEELYALSADNFGMLDHSLMGDQHSLYSGELSFSQTDVSLPTNLELPINITRGKQKDVMGTYRIFGDWYLDIPRLYGPMLGNFQVGPDRCSTVWFTGRYIAGIQAHESSNGPLLGGVQASEVLMEHDGSLPAPANTLFINKDNWVVTCSNNIYKAISPDGLIYTFGELVFKLGEGAPTNIISQAWSDVMLMVTRIEDRFGKSIIFNYQNGFIQSIQSSDSAAVTFGYNTENKVSSVMVNDRLWTYHYSDKKLVKVIRPDNSKWEYDLDSLYPQLSGSETIGSGTVYHPYGAVGVFTVEATIHGRSRVSTIKNSGTGHYSFKPNVMYPSLVSKTISGPNLPTMSWNYTYSENAGGYQGTAVSDTKYVAVVNPEAVETTYTFQRSFDWEEGQIKKIVVKDRSGVLQTQNNSWTGGSRIGRTLADSYSDTNKDTHRVNLTTKTIIRDADSFVSTFSDFDLWGLPGTVNETTNFSSKKRIIKNTYFHDLAHWLIGFPAEKSISTDGAVFSSLNKTAYYATEHQYKSLPSAMYEYGLLRKTYSNYYMSGISAGLPNKVLFSDGRGYLTFGAYKRGTPSSLTRPASLGSGSDTAYLSVDDNGWIEKITDYAGNITSYGYNSLGWRTSVNPQDTKWSDTTTSYVFNGESLTLTVSRGDYRNIKTLDGYLRPILVQEYDTKDIDTSRYQRIGYDSDNRTVFSSFPANSPIADQGIETEYDGIGRPLILRNTTNNSVTSYRHLYNNRVRETNPRGHVTDTTYLSYGSPDERWPVRIEAPHNFTTSINYNIFGSTTSVSQGGIIEHRVYNSYQQLCKVIRPDVGNVAYSYNSFGQLSWEAKGSSVDSVVTACSDSVAASDKTTFSYDNRGSIRNVAFADGSADKTYNYDKQGNLTTLAAGSAVWDYTYNSANLMETEILTLDNISWLIDLEYNTLGQVSSVVYPSGNSVSYAPNALGQPTRAGDYAISASYYPNGQLKGFTYGNGLSFSQLLDSQQRPEYQTVKRSSSNVLNHRYQYDNNHNIDTISDLITPAKNISLTYDDLDRLDTATGFWGSGSFDYDSVGNITQKTLGNQSLTYAYNTSNRLTGISGAVSRTFAYDSRGNVTNNGQRAFSFNLANQLITSGTNSYQYDGYNRRVKKVSNGKTQYSLYNAAGQLLMTDGDKGLTEYIYLGNKLIAKESAVPTSEDTPGYTGHLEDDDLQLTYMQQRYYDPLIGRFYSNDPVGFTASNPMMFNRYAYANNNPYKYIDPDGRKPGDAFPNPRQAAHDWGKTYNGDSIKQNKELGSTIYQYINPEGDNQYSYNEPAIGTSTGVNPNTKLEQGQTAVSKIHSHASYDNNKYSNTLSKTDIDNHKSAGDEFVTMPNGSLVGHDKKTHEVIATDLPSDPLDPGRLNEIDP
ncbi:RHS repeat-associated core domain-containing protein [Rheinheimera sp.]|uniref:RHS repeat-associated core domain-containing protein n=1 Tax=Rheinheimera sp. TaxID=1869214 RepID=UPI00273761B5|nr:RHS repeat-associated core domain-containing protein [Rheinheimera sp.]MDP2714944.1 RHS repeat-associated core domain-containing protein [Rheinheimera sp.]